MQIVNVNNDDFDRFREAERAGWLVGSGDDARFRWSGREVGAQICLRGIGVDADPNKRFRAHL